MFEDLNPAPANEQPGDPSPFPEAAPAFPSDTAWKDRLRQDFETWLATLDHQPEPEGDLEAPGAAPDLYSFYEQLAAANAEARKANRRTAEAISQWGDTLLRFENCLAPLRESVVALTATRPKEGRLSRAHCLVLVEWLDRLHRLARAFTSPPVQRSWWARRDRAWREAWEAQRQGFDIVVGHLEDFLEREGVTPLDVLDQPFDPTTMTAVATQIDPTRPDQSVLEELAPGYRHEGELLRPAQVKVSRRA